MRLTTHTDYAIRTLMFLAATDRRATAAEIAGVFGISLNHLAKVVHHLARLGYIRSIRGLGGGLELVRPADSIRLGELVVALEGNLHLLECIATDQVCVIEHFCQLKGVFAEAERLQLEYLNTKTLGDVVPTRRQLAQLGPA